MLTVKNSPSVVTSQASKASALREKIKIDESKLGNLIFKIAETKSELEQAFKLVYNAYIQIEYMNPHPSGMRLHPLHVLQNSTIFIGVHNDKVVTTMALSPDSELGLPMDCIYQEELATIRHQKRRFAEIGALASDPNFRYRDFTIPLHLNKIMYLYAKQYLQLDDLVIGVVPKHQSFYTAILPFQQIGAIKAYQGINQNPVILLRLNLHTEEDDLYQTYHKYPIEKNLYHFFCLHDSECIYLPYLNNSRLKTKTA
ncbi:hypothetical protein NC981_00730 [Leptolyngbya sp. DQ-M1]|uniref:N-acyl amino acid synthase FeeM domain-containing protein n=1 Tax=Leptolyngbya sp. DQ-M1 TaxID=2933920 RepID=UPI0032981CC0